MHTRFDSCHDGPAGLEYSVVDNLLVFSELSVGREGAGDVTSIATVLTTHVKQTARKRTNIRYVYVPPPLCHHGELLISTGLTLIPTI